MKRLPVWDLPLRLFHWSLVILVVGAVATAEVGGSMMEWHARCGFAILGLLLFRLVWGFWGGTYARYKHCLPSLRVLIASFPERRKRHRFGHTPLGRFALAAMLGALMVQTGSGLFANDDIDLEGPLFRHVSKATSDWLTGLHKLSAYVIGALVALHLAAILYYYLRKGDNLILPMIRGWREADDHVPEVLAAQGGSTALGFFLISVCTAITWFVVERL